VCIKRSVISLTVELVVTSNSLTNLEGPFDAIYCQLKKIGKVVLYGPLGLQEVETPEFSDNRHMNVVRLSALRTGRLYPPGKVPGTHFYYRLSRPQSPSTAGKIRSMENSNGPIRN
jgi:hypothetical protein